MSLFANLRFEGVLVSDIGTKREKNQDYGLCIPEEGLFIVADGMGGHRGGEIASKMCVETLHQVLSQGTKDQESDSEPLTDALRAANRAIYEKSLEDPSLSGMGTTLTALKLAGPHATILQVGDSRAYFWNRSGIWQITRDHSYVQEKIRAGLIQRDQEKTDEMRNFITRSVGYELDVSGDLFRMDVEAGDGFLLCSDGLSGALDDESIHALLKSGDSAEIPLMETAKRLVNEANARSGDDNVTVILAKARTG